MISAHTFDPYLDQLAHLIANNGIESFEGDIARLAVRLRGAGQCSALIDLLVDHGAASVARERAFGRLAASLIAAEAAPLAAPTRLSTAPAPAPTLLSDDQTAHRTFEFAA